MAVPKVVPKRGHGLETIFAPNQVAQEPGGMQVNLLPELAMVNKSAWAEGGLATIQSQPVFIHFALLFLNQRNSVLSFCLWKH